MKNLLIIVIYFFKNIYCYICSMNRDFMRNFNDMDFFLMWYFIESFIFFVYELFRKIFIWEYYYLFDNIMFNLDIIME